MLRELMEKIQQPQAATAATTTASDSESVSEYVGYTNAQQTEEQVVDEITMPRIAEQNVQEQEPQAAASKPSSKRNGDTDEDL
jgi:hypothetical protein